MEPATQHANLRKSVGAVMQHIDELLVSLRTGPQAGANIDEAASRNIETTLSALCDSFFSFQSRFNKQNLVVAVLALTKSGKPPRHRSKTV